MTCLLYTSRLAAHGDHPLDNGGFNVSKVLVQDHHIPMLFLQCIAYEPKQGDVVVLHKDFGDVETCLLYTSAWKNWRRSPLPSAG